LKPIEIHRIRSSKSIKLPPDISDDNLSNLVVSELDSLKLWDSDSEPGDVYMVSFQTATGFWFVYLCDGMYTTNKVTKDISVTTTTEEWCMESLLRVMI
jgi:hypothetical protein